MNEPISVDLARIIANLSGDGNWNPRYARYNNTCKELLDEFVEAMNREFGELHFTKGRGNSGTSFVQVNKRIIIRFLQQFHSNYKSESIFIPSCIWKDRKVAASYLCGLYDDEGSPGLRLYAPTKEWKRDISISGKLCSFMQEVKSLLIEHFGIVPGKIVLNKNKRGEWYSFAITGRRNIILFRKEIGFRHPEKKARLNLLINSYGKTAVRDPVGFSNIELELKRLKELAAIRASRNLCSTTWNVQSLNFRVRNGTECFPLAMTANKY